MRRYLLGALVVALLVGAFFLGRWSRGPETAAHATEPLVDGRSVVEGGSGRALPPAPSTRAPVYDEGARPAGSPAFAGARGATPPREIPVSATAAGPQPLKPGDEPRLDKAESIMGADGGTTRDLLDLAANEEQDDRGRQLEALLLQSILRHGGRYTQLRLSSPHCTRSVCIIRGIGAGQAQDPRSDWQRLSGAIMGEPWFREAFDDMRSMVTGDGPDTVYITLYIRCTPGACRYGRR